MLQPPAFNLLCRGPPMLASNFVVLALLWQSAEAVHMQGRLFFHMISDPLVGIVISGTPPCGFI